MTYRSGQRRIVRETDKATDDRAQTKREENYLYKRTGEHRWEQSRAGLLMRHRWCNNGATKRAGKPKRLVNYKKYNTAMTVILHVLCFWQSNFKMQQEHCSLFPASPQKNTECRSQVSPDIELQPSLFMHNSVLHLWHVKVFLSYLHCRASCAIVKVIAFPCVFAHVPPVPCYHCCRDKIAYPPYPPRTIHLEAHGWKWHANMQQNGLTNAPKPLCVRAYTYTHTVTGIQGK